MTLGSAGSATGRMPLGRLPPDRDLGSAARAYHMDRVTVPTATPAIQGSHAGSSADAVRAAFQARPTVPPPSRMKPSAVWTDMRLKWPHPYAPGTPAAYPTNAAVPSAMTIDPSTAG